MNLEGLSIGHYTNEKGGTGVTVFLPDERFPCGMWLSVPHPQVAILIYLILA